ncbi:MULTISPECIES: sensor histidine kinase [unclassified Colwellia]|uniref:sensor histidine kinase n=1 Tax=unclassified Colwellia TaxID=196834 RepID=UPI0015F5EE0D|nr:MULTISPECIES: PAS domain-containing sensor histidine kinase [unclassified Colwellia]MBA6357143.1 PAS domain-containing sensor histidine kinase [Colwellia sp. BRX8-3]MBA6360899.1 PAS domain-containing sensor histidine kinase [Colwellia sp. BRX8-6]MBA6369165.1 PAS domain-containing sensor histidine kinase [Colwellia sp. BRX8-5]MBA6376067.1 PAS domain-containing sensor histidine kinase [Colwellia sp. BRX8-2]
MTNSEQQLEFIRLLSLDSETNFTNTEHFSFAMKKLSMLLNSPFFIFTVVYKDIQNKKSHYNSYCLNTQNNELSEERVVVNVNQSELPDTICLLNRQLQEIKQSKSQVTVSFLNKTGFSDSQDDNCFVLPFSVDDELIGVISYQANTPNTVIKTSSPLYQFIHYVFSADHTNRQKGTQINTLQTVLNLMPQRVFWKNRESVYLGSNKAFSNDAHLNSPSDIVGVTDFDIFPEQAELYRSDDAHTMTSREHLIASEEPQTHANGKTIWLRTSKRPIINEFNEVIGIVGTYDDISELKNMQVELSKARDELEEKVEERTKELSQTYKKLAVAFESLKSTQDQLVESEKMAALGNLVAGVAHEINTPLGIAVTGASNLEHSAQLIKKAVESGKIRRTAFVNQCNSLIGSSDIILRNLERASELVRNFQRIAVDQSNDEKRTINFFKYLNDIISTLSSLVSEKNIKIFLSGDETLPLLTSPGTIAQIVTILIDNALTHAFKGIINGQIKISFKVQNEMLMLTVQDNGCGIEVGKIEKVFEPFYTTQRQKGSGLGLSILYNLVTQILNGKVTCFSTVDESTQFVIALPLD